MSPSLSLGLVTSAHSALWDWVLLNRHRWHQSLPAASTARTSVVARGVLGLAECVLAQRFCQFTLPQSAGDPPDLKTAKGKGDQSQLDTLSNMLGHE